MDRSDEFPQDDFNTTTRGGKRPSWLLPALASLALGLAGGIGGYFVASALDDNDSVTSSAPATLATSHTAATKSSSGSGALTINQIYDEYGPGVVHITSQIEQQTQSIFGYGQTQRGEASGSGFVIDSDGHIVTNYHVVEGATKVTVSFSSNDSTPAKVIGSDPSTDIAVLKVDLPDDKGLTPLSFGDSSDVQVGDQVVAIGNPFNLDRTVTAGIVSALQREIPSPDGGFGINNAIQTDASVNQGNSGGPLLNAQGEVIGINSQIETGNSNETGNVGIAFAIPSNTVQKVVKELIDGGSVEHAFLGIEGTDVTEQLAQVFHLPVKQGAMIGNVFKGSPAADAGLKGGDTQVQVEGQTYSIGGDIITKFDGHEITSMRQVVQYVDQAEPGDKVEIEYYRGNEKKTTTVKLDKRPTSSTSSSDSNQEDPLRQLQQ